MTHAPGLCANANGEWCDSCMLPIRYAAASGDPYERSVEHMRWYLDGRPDIWEGQRTGDVVVDAKEWLRQFAERSGDADLWVASCIIDGLLKELEAATAPDPERTEVGT